MPSRVKIKESSNDMGEFLSFFFSTGGKPEDHQIAGREVKTY